MVTGATDGIGKEFAFQLGKAGFNIFLVARNEELLLQTAAEIGEFPCGVEKIGNSYNCRDKTQGLYTNSFD